MDLNYNFTDEFLLLLQKFGKIEQEGQQRFRLFCDLIHVLRHFSKNGISIANGYFLSYENDAIDRP